MQLGQRSLVYLLPGNITLNHSHSADATRRSSRRWRRALLVAAVCLTAAISCAPAGAQTAQFTDAVNSLEPGFSFPQGVAVDGSGNVYVADENADGAVKEIAAGCSSSSCVTWLGGGFNGPAGVAVDASGNVYVADTFNGAVKEIPAGCASSSCVTTLGGAFNYPNAVTVDGSGNIYVADTNNSLVKEMPAGCASSSCVTTLGGGFFFPSGVAVDASGNVYVADSENGQVKEMPPGCTAADYSSHTCTITTLGGGFSSPYGVAVDRSGNVYIGDDGTSTVSEMPAGCASSSCVTTLGGGFSFPYGVALDTSGNVYVGDAGNNAVKEIMRNAVNFFSKPVAAGSALTLNFTFTGSGTIKTPQVLTQGATGLDFTDAGTGSCDTNGTSHSYNAGDTCSVNVTFTPKHAGMRIGAADLVNSSGAVIATAKIYGTGTGPQVAFLPGTESTIGSGLTDPLGVTVDSAGNVYIVDLGNGAVHKYAPNGTQLADVAGGLLAPDTVAVDGAGNVYIAGGPDNAVHKFVPNGSGGYRQVSDVANGLNQPTGVTVDGAGTVYVANSAGNQVLRYAPNGSGGYTRFSNVGSSLNGPVSVAVDATGNIYIASYYSGMLKVPPTDVGCTVAGDCTTVGSGLSNPYAVVVDAAGNVYIADSGNGRVLKVPPTDLTCATAADCTTVRSGLSDPLGVAVDASGNVYITDSGNARALKEDSADAPTLSFAATSVGATSSDSPQTVTVENIGNATLTLELPTASGSHNPSVSTNFLYDNSSTCTQTDSSSSTAYTLASGASCDVAIDFAPVSVNSITGSAVLTDNALNAAAPVYTMQTIGLNGTGNPVQLTVSVNDVSRAYGMANPTLTGSASGLVGSDTVASVGLAYSTTATSGSPVGAYPITASITSTNYTLNSTPGTLTVTAPLLTVSANSATRVYGAANPSFTGTVGGLVNGDTASSVGVAYATTATAGSAVGSYPITASITSPNYTLSATSGALTITQAASTTTLNASSTSATPGQSVTLTATVASTTTGTPTGTVSFYDGTTLLNTATLSGGTATYATAALSAGATHSLTAVYSGDPNFTGSTSNSAVGVAVQPAQFTMNVMGTSSAYVEPGESFTYQMQVSPTYGSYAGPVSFTATGLPPGGTATFSPSSIAANAGPTTVNVTITVPANTTAANHPSQTARRLAPLSFALLLLPFAGSLRKRGRNVIKLFCVALALAGIAGLSGCSSNTLFSPAKQSYNVTITATAGSLTQTAAISITVE